VSYIFETSILKLNINTSLKPGLLKKDLLWYDENRFGFSMIEVDGEKVKLIIKLINNSNDFTNLTKTGSKYLRLTEACDNLTIWSRDRMKHGIYKS